MYCNRHLDLICVVASFNLAQNKEAWVHEEAVSPLYPACLGVDGDVSTFGQSNNFTGRLFFGVDLGAGSSVSSVRVSFVSSK